jgi:hypothetical protein
MKTKRITKIQSLNLKRHKILQDMSLEDFDFILDHQTRRVRWLYANSNKMTMVYEERLVRMMIQKLQNRIKELQK